MKLGLVSDIHAGREKGSLLNSAFFPLKPPASSVYVHVLEAHSPLIRSISVMSPFPSLREKVRHGDLAKVQPFECDRDGLTRMVVGPGTVSTGWIRIGILFNLAVDQVDDPIQRNPATAIDPGHFCPIGHDA